MGNDVIDQLKNGDLPLREDGFPGKSFLKVLCPRGCISEHT